MASYQDDLGRKVDSMVPYRSNPDNLVWIRDKQILLNSDQKKDLDFFDSKIDYANKKAKKYPLSLSDTFWSAYAGFIIGGFISIPISLVLSALGYSGLAEAGFMFFSSIGVLGLPGYAALEGHKINRDNLKQKQQEKQQFLENLIK